MRFFQWKQKPEKEQNAKIEKGWLILENSMFRLSCISCVQLYEKKDEGEYVIGVIIESKWYSIYRSDSIKNVNENFEKFKEFLFSE